MRSIKMALLLHLSINLLIGMVGGSWSASAHGELFALAKNGKADGGNANAAPVNKGEDAENRVEKDIPVTFPYQLPGSRTDVDRDVVDKANTFRLKSEQVRFLVDLLPTKNAKDKRLNDEQLAAIRLLGLTESEDAIKPLIVHLAFGHPRDGSPAAHALARLGERTVEPLIKAFEEARTEKQNALFIDALSVVKGDEFAQFAEELAARKDTKLTKEKREQLTTQAKIEKSIDFH